MKKTVLIIYLLATALVASAAGPVVQFERLEQRLAWIQVLACDSPQVITEFDSALAKLKNSQGWLIEMNCADEPLLDSLLGRLSDATIAGDSLKIIPAGPWQTTNPVVFLSSAKFSAQPKVQTFVHNRLYAQLEPSERMAQAKNKLRLLVFQMQREQRDKMDRMLNGK